MLTEKKLLNKKLNNLFYNLKIKNKDNIFLHSNSIGIQQFCKNKLKKDELYKLFINKILVRIGTDGTLILPTYNYDFTKGKTFNYDSCNSQVGELTNFFLKKFKPVRTIDPIFSHAILGKLKKIFDNLYFLEAFGDRSVFELLYKKNFKIVGFCSPLMTTFLHYIEKKLKVKYRFNKIFYSKIKKNNKTTKVKYKYYVGKKKIDYSIKSSNLEIAFKNYKKFYFSEFGRFYCWSISARDCYRKISDEIRKNENFLIK